MLALGQRHRGGDDRGGFLPGRGVRTGDHGGPATHAKCEQGGSASNENEWQLFVLDPTAAGRSKAVVPWASKGSVIQG